MEEILPNNLLKILKNGESITVEFKEAKKKLPDSLFESICSIYSGGIPEFKDDEIFKVKIPLEKIEDKKYISSQELKRLLYEFISEGEGKSRKEINDFIYPILSETMSRMDSRVRTALTYLRTKEFIENSGTDTKPIWIKK